MRKVNAHGQPLIRSVKCESRLSDRNLDELIGLCRGVIADGIVNQVEAEVLLNWIKRHEHGMGSFPANVLFARLTDALEDGRLDSDEAKDVFELIAECVGATGDIEMDLCTTTLPLDDPQPDLIFKHRNYVVTGRFAYGPRDIVRNVITYLGGNVKDAVTGQIDYLVCGHFASRDWMHTSHGRKIEDAMLRRDNGQEIYIISERHWAQTIERMI